MIKLTNYEKESSNHLHCKLQSQRELKNRVINNLSLVLEKYGYELVIPIENLPAYYNLPITEYQFTKSQIIIKIPRVPGTL